MSKGKVDWNTLSDVREASRQSKLIEENANSEDVQKVMVFSSVFRLLFGVQFTGIGSQELRGVGNQGQGAESGELREGDLGVGNQKMVVCIDYNEDKFYGMLVWNSIRYQFGINQFAGAIHINM